MNETFDEVATDYDAQLQKGLSLTGESKEYFAEGRMRWLRARLDKMGEEAKRALDFGCGTGSATPYFFDILGVEKLEGSDVSQDSLEVARGKYSGRHAVDYCDADDLPEGVFDLAFCNGVFHHIEPEDRSAAFKQVVRALKPGGVFAFWENNPWNPGTRWSMSRVPFDADAVLVWPGQARKLLRSEGFEILRTISLLFPKNALDLPVYGAMALSAAFGGAVFGSMPQRVGVGRRLGFVR